MKVLTNPIVLFLCLILGWANLHAGSSRFVAAPSGLNMRATSDPGSARLMTVPYGSKVEFIRDGSGETLTIDGLKGSMVQVNYEGQDGYMFSGYLSELPLAVKRNDLAGYAERIRNHGFEVIYEEHRFDYGGYLSDSEAIHVYNHNWQQAWLMARSMVEIPSELSFPAFAGDRELIVKNPKADHLAWSDEMMAVFKPTGELESLTYYWRGEGSGWSIGITPSEVGNGLRIEVTFIAD